MRTSVQCSVLPLFQVENLIHECCPALSSPGEGTRPLSQMPAGGSTSVLAMIVSVSVSLSLRDS